MQCLDLIQLIFQISKVLKLLDITNIFFLFLKNKKILLKNLS